MGYSPWGCKESDTTEWLSTAQQGASVVSDQLFEILWTIACQAALSMGFSRQYRSGLPFPSPGDLPNQGIEPASLMSPALVGEFFTAGAAWEAQDLLYGFFFFFFFFFKDKRSKIDLFKELQPSFKQLASRRVILYQDRVTP